MRPWRNDVLNCYHARRQLEQWADRIGRQSRHIDAWGGPAPSLQGQIAAGPYAVVAISRIAGRESTGRYGIRERIT